MWLLLGLLNLLLLTVQQCIRDLLSGIEVEIVDILVKLGEGGAISRIPFQIDTAVSGINFQGAHLHVPLGVEVGCPRGGSETQKNAEYTAIAEWKNCIKSGIGGHDLDFLPKHIQRGEFTVYEADTNGQHYQPALHFHFINQPTLFSLTLLQHTLITLSQPKQQIQQEYNSDFVSRLIIMLASKHILSRVHRPVFTTAARFSEFEHRKKYDLNKASLQLLLEPLKTNMNIDVLKQTKQYNVTQINKILALNNQSLNLGECVDLIVDGEMITLKKDGFRYFFNFVETFLFQEHKDFASLNIHNRQTLSNFFTVYLDLEKKTHHKISRLFLVFMALYSQECKDLPALQKQMIMAFLSQRLYFPQFLIDSIRSIQVKPQASLTSAEDIESMGYKIKMIENLLRAQESGMAQLIPGLQENLKTLNIQFSTVLEDPNMFETICSMNPESVFLPSLFVEAGFRHKYHNMILKMFEPDRFYMLKLHEKTFKKIFTCLLMFSTDDEKVVRQIVERFILCINLYYSNPKQVLFPSNLIMLCDHFDFKIPELRWMMPAYQFNELEKYESAFFSKKNVLDSKNILIKYYYQMGLAYKQMPSTIPNKQREEYIHRIEAVFYENKLNLFDDLISLLVQKQTSQIRDTEIAEHSEQSFLANYLQFLKCDSKKRNSTIAALEKQLGVMSSEKQLRDHTYPINMKTSVGARIKILIWTIYMYMRLVDDSKKIEAMFNIFKNNRIILENIQKYAWYPGLLECFFFMFAIVEPRLEPNIFKSSISVYLKTQSESLNQIFYKIINKGSQGLNKRQSVYYSKYVEHMSPSVCRDLNAYDAQYNMEMAMINGSQYHYTKRCPELREKVQDELRSYFSRFAKKNLIKVVPFYIEYPYVTDFMISLRGKSIAIFIQREEGEDTSLLRSQEGKDETRGQENESTSSEETMLPSLQEMSIEHFKKTCTIILVKNEEDARNICPTFDRKR